MTITSLCGFLQMNFNRIRYKKVCNKNLNVNVNSPIGTNQISSSFFKVLIHKFHFWRDMLIVGALR
jgi:hypothetical protein